MPILHVLSYLFPPAPPSNTLSVAQLIHTPSTQPCVTSPCSLGAEPQMGAVCLHFHPSAPVAAPNAYPQGRVSAPRCLCTFVFPSELNLSLLLTLLRLSLFLSSITTGPLENNPAHERSLGTEQAPAGFPPCKHVKEISYRQRNQISFYFYFFSYAI